MTLPIVVGITGASGAIYAVRLLDVLRDAGRDVHLTISTSGRDVIAHELKLNVNLDNFDPGRFLLSGKEPGSDRRGKLHYYHYNDFMAPMASGSYITAGMVICPCSGTTLSAGASSGVIAAASSPRREAGQTKRASIQLCSVDRARAFSATAPSMSRLAGGNSGAATWSSATSRTR